MGHLGPWGLVLLYFFTWFGVTLLFFTSTLLGATLLYFFFTTITIGPILTMTSAQVVETSATTT